MKRTGTLTRLHFVFSLLLCFFILTATPINLLGQYVVNFEGPGETKTSYATGTVNLSGLDWNLTEALIGLSEADWKNGARSTRMRGYATSSMSMLENKPNGMGTLSFQYRRYGSDPQLDWKAEYSIDNGASWIQVGSAFTAPESDDVQTFSEAVNVSGNIRVRIKRATDDDNVANRRLNIDDITITDYAAGPYPPAITNIVQTPSANITPETTVSVSASVQPGSAAINKVELRWGVSAGNHPNTINMAAGSGNTFSTANDIPAQNDGTTVYYIVYADGTDDESAMSAEQSYEVKEEDPIDGHLETFDLSNATASYGDNSFTGDMGFTWSFVHSRDEGDFAIDGKGLMLRRADEPSSLSATIPGGIGSFSVDTRKAFTGNTQRKIELVINGGVVEQFEPAFGDGADNTVIPFVVENINTAGNVEFMLRLYGANGNQQMVIDNIRWTSYSGDGNTPPAITNITQTPATDITSSTTVSVSADVTDTDGTVEQVELRWGTATGSHPNTIVMNVGTGNTYTTATDIPAQTSGITVYYVVYAEDDDGDSSVSGERNYTVQDPLTTTLPYTNTFDTRLGEVYVYNASGPTRTWAHRTAADNGYAEMNGFGGSPLEEDWLILPGINMNDYETIMMTFDTYWQYGEDDENNYLKLLYSTDYAGIGNTAEATWHELSFNVSSTSQAWVESGNIDLSDISGEKVYIAFKYHYGTGKYRLWRVDNISLSEVAQPILQAMPSHISQYTYEVDEGPSDIYAFALSGANLDGSNVSLTVPDYFEIAFTDQVFGANLTLQEYDGNETTILTRMKAGLGADTYEGQITISGGGADDIHVTLSGVVTAPAPPPPGLPYTQNFEAFVFENGTEIPHFGEDQEWNFLSSGNQLIYQGDWGTGFSAGFRGNSNLMGYQHTSSTGLFVAMLKLENDTEETITSLDIAYTGKVERASEGRSPAWMVMVNDTEASALYYSTEDGVDKNISATIDGLNILPGEVFTISWGSERGGPAGSSRQIGITDVSVEVAETSDIISATISPDEFVFEDFPDAENYVTTITWNDASEVTRAYVVLNEELDLTYQVEDIDGLTATLTMMVPARKMQALKSGSVEVDGYVVFDKGLPAHFRVIYTNPVFEVEVFVLNHLTGDPVAEASVYVQETEETSVADGSGLAVFFLNAGDYTLNITAEGYVSLMNHPIAVIADPQADHTFEVRLVPDDVVDPDPLALPYFNPLRTDDDYAAALDDGFSIHEATQATAAGGYLRIFPDGYIQSPPILLEELGGLAIAFDATTFGGTTGQTLTVKVSDDGGNTFSDIQAYEIPGSYETFQTEIDLQAYTSESLILRVEMTAGTNSTRLRDMHINDPLAEFMVSFTVTDGEDPIAGATITIGEDSQTTNTEGMAEFSLPNGTYSYSVTAEGYDDIADVQLTVSNDDVSETVVMTRTTYTINASAGDNGSINPSGEISVDHGEDQVFVVNPNENHHIAFVKVDGTDINLETDENWNAANRQYTFSNVTQNHTIEAGFAINTYTIEASAGDNGSIDPSGEISVNHGGNQVFTINPNQGYRISFVNVDGSNINLGTDGNWNAGNRQYTFSNVTQNHTIEAGFEVDDTGLSSPEFAALKIYPNPVADILFIESDEHITRLEIIDMTGRLVYREEPATQQLSIDATALYNGIYFVRIITPAGMTTKRIQVAR
jgi:hypothetical protein